MKLTILRIKFLIISLIILNIILASRWIIDGNIFFHTDIARDFLLMEDMVDNKHPALIGPRSGAIPGLFHGPLWLYINLPAYLIGNGDPAIVGRFWVMLYILSLFVTYSVGKKMYGEEEGLLSTLLLSTITILSVRALFNPYGALILSPLFFYTFILYIKRLNVKILLLSLFLLGLIIQFQMAFGVPTLILTIGYLIYYLFKKKKLSHFLAFFILIIPLSTYILFEFRNNFLQIKSVADYLFGNQTHGKLDINLFQLTILRIKEFILDGVGMMTQTNIYLTIPLFLFLIFGFYKIFKNRNEYKNTYLLFILFFAGFWFFTIFFKGPVWNYYFIPFFPLLSLIFVSLRNTNKTIFYPLFIFIYFLNLQTSAKDILSYNADVSKQDVSTWKFNELVAKQVFSGAENTFGYFIFTPDLYGYSPRYALDFYQKRNPQKVVSPYKKREITYLIIAPPPEYGKDPNSIWYQKNINSASWKSSDVKIDKNPERVVSFENGFGIEKYRLSEIERKIEANPYLINGIFFR